MTKDYSMDDYPMEINNSGLEYLNKLSDLDREDDLRELIEFLDFVDTWDPGIKGIDPLQSNFFEANDFNLSVNRILHKYMGFDERIAKDFFFRRFQSITKHVVFNYELDKEETIFRFKLNLWGEFTINKLIPEMFKALESLINVKQIRHIYINAKKLIKSISTDLFEYTPDVEFIQLDIMEPIEIPIGIFKNTQFVRDISLYYVSKIPNDIFRFAPRLTTITIKGNCQIDSTIFHYTPLLKDITLQYVQGISKNLLEGLQVKFISFNKCKFRTTPLLHNQGGVSDLETLKITNCKLSTEFSIKRLVNHSNYPNLSLLDIYNNTPSTRAYNNLHSIIIPSSRDISLTLNLENDLVFACGESLPNVIKLSILLRNNHTTMDSVKKLLSIFPRLSFFNIKGGSLDNGLINSSNFDKGSITDICPELSVILISLDQSI